MGQGETAARKPLARDTIFPTVQPLIHMQFTQLPCLQQNEHFFRCKNDLTMWTLKNTVQTQNRTFKIIVS